MNEKQRWISVRASDQTGVMVWLMGLCGMILLMVAVGGITRLTDSGLSMVEWEPILGAIPPLSHEDWEMRFEQYRNFPEYQQINQGMSLGEFKSIYFWEYLHRLLGRLIGVVFLIPFLIFLFRGAFSRKTGWLFFLAFLLGGGQGFMGWYMVQSGLSENPMVSHYRLAAHFWLAVILFGYLLVLLLHLMKGQARELPVPGGRPVRHLAWGVLGLLVVQMTYGAFVAGLNAGFIHNTFPTMTGYWLHPDALALPTLAANLLDNPVMVQWVHRVLGIIVLFAVSALWWMGRGRLPKGGARSALHLVFAVTVAQVVLGVVVLLTAVPVSLGTLHQVLACILLGVMIKLLHELHLIR